MTTTAPTWINNRPNHLTRPESNHHDCESGNHHARDIAGAQAHSRSSSPQRGQEKALSVEPTWRSMSSEQTRQVGSVIAIRPGR
jgi:hypothetical protein